MPVSAQKRSPGPSQASLKAGHVLKECRNCPELVVVPPGTFMMGSPADEPERRPSERQHKVTIARAFAIGKTQVTWDQWEACVRDRWCDGLGDRTRAPDPGGRRPAEPRLQGLRPRHASGGRRQLVRRADVRRLAELEDRRGRRLPPAVRRRVGVRRARRHDDGLSVGRQARSQLRQLRHRRPRARRQGRGPRSVGQRDRPGRVVPAQRVRPLRHARQRLRVGGGLLRGGPRARAGGRLGEQGRQLRQPRVPQRHVPQQSRHAPLGETRRAVSRHAPRAATISGSASPRRWSERRAYA